MKPIFILIAFIAFNISITSAQSHFPPSNVTYHLWLTKQTVEQDNHPDTNRARNFYKSYDDFVNNKSAPGG